MLPLSLLPGSARRERCVSQVGTAARGRHVTLSAQQPARRQQHRGVSPRPRLPSGRLARVRAGRTEKGSTMHTVIRVIGRTRIVSLIALLAVAFVMLACAATVVEAPKAPTTKVPTTGPGGDSPIAPPPPRVHTVSSRYTFSAEARGGITYGALTDRLAVECPANEVRLGGGYNLMQEPRNGKLWAHANPIASLPSMTWLPPSMPNACASQLVR
jgi:hypothetical protein